MDVLKFINKSMSVFSALMTGVGSASCDIHPAKCVVRCEDFVLDAIPLSADTIPIFIQFRDNSGEPVEGHASDIGLAVALDGEGVQGKQMPSLQAGRHIYQLKVQQPGEHAISATINNSLLPRSPGKLVKLSHDPLLTFDPACAHQVQLTRGNMTAQHCAGVQHCKHFVRTSAFGKGKETWSIQVEPCREQMAISVFSLAMPNAWEEWENNCKIVFTSNGKFGFGCGLPRTRCGKVRGGDIIQLLMDCDKGALSVHHKRSRVTATLE